MKYRLTLLIFVIISSAGILIGRNPAIDAPQNRTSNPSAHVWADGKMYVYVSYPEKDCTFSKWHVFSSQDLVTWIDHDLQFGLKDTKWAAADAGGPDCMEKNGKYYFYYPAQAANKKGIHTGVAVGDSPVGPFREVSGKPLLENAPSPAVFKDDDGTCYLYSQTKVVRLNDDMISLAEPVRKIKLTGHELPAQNNAVSVFKKNGVYFWTIAENLNTITYWTGNSPYGPFAYQGVLMDPIGKDNHHSVVEYNGYWLLFYHRWMNIGDNFAQVQGQRVCIDEITFNIDGSIRKVNTSDKGVEFTYLFPKKSSMKDMWYEDENFVGYLFVHMTTEDYGKMYYALSKDGLHFKDVNKSKRIYEDYRGHPCITRGHDGRYYIVGGGSPIQFWVTSDFVTWEKYSEFMPDVTKAPNFLPGVRGGGAPKVFYDTKTSLYIITWQTSLYSKRSGIPHPLEDERYWGGQRALFAISKDLKTFSDPRVLLPEFNSGQLDIFVTRLGEKYYTIFKDERYPSYEWPTGKTVRICSSDNLTGLYGEPGPSVSPNFCEAPSLVPKLDGTGYYMYFERYQGNGYEIATAPKMEGPWYDVYKEEYDFPSNCRHGWIHPITQKQWDEIVKAFGEE